MNLHVALAALTILRESTGQRWYPVQIGPERWIVDRRDERGDSQWAVTDVEGLCNVLAMYFNWQFRPNSSYDYPLDFDGETAG